MHLRTFFSKLALLIGCAASLQADIVSLSVWKRTTSFGDEQYVICCGDQHNLWVCQTEQANDLVEYFRKRDCKSDCILLEDITGYELVLNYVDRYLKERMKKHTLSFKESILEDFSRSSTRAADGVLSQIRQYAKEHGIRAVNHEHRYAIVGRSNASAPLVGWWYVINYFMLNQILEELKKYNDDETLNRFYKDIIDRYTDVEEMLQKGRSIDTIRKQFSTDKHYGKEHPFKNFYENSEEDLFVEVLDARFLHDIYQLQIKQEKSNLIAVCAGVAHTFNIETILPKLGYEYIGGRPFYSPYLAQYKEPIDIKSYLNDIFSDSNKLQAKL